MIVHKALSDGMDRGKHEFWAKEVVVDPLYYVQNEMNRGDVVYYDILKAKDKLQDGHQIHSNTLVSRVVGLSGEKIGIEDGQIFINGKKLLDDT